MDKPSPFSQSGTTWNVHVNRRAVTEQRQDGGSITHIRPQCGKTLLPRLESMKGDIDMVDTKKFGTTVTTVEQKLSDFPVEKLCLVLGRSLLPPALIASVERLQVGEILLHALGSIEQVAWEDHLPVVVSRAEAYALSARVYDDLSLTDWTALSEHIREREAARKVLLQAMFSESDAN